jgi:predicted site-specific integrase-resolvase
VDRRPGELSAQEVADLLGIRADVIYYWIQHGTLAARQQRSHSRYWIPMDATKEQERRAMVRASYRIRKSHDLQPKNRS